MKNLIFILLCIVLVAGIIFFFPTEKKQPVSPLPALSPTPELSSPSSRTGKEQLSLFVPYWSAAKLYTEKHNFDQLIYFGVTPTTNGVNKQDEGYVQLKSFVTERPIGMRSALAIRMLDKDTNFVILKDSVKQKSVIQDSIAVAKAHNFDGIVLDLELSALPFESLIQQINTFTKNLSQAAKKEKMSFAMAIYGDTFYRLRPFEVKTLATYSDQIMIMAYDFSKAKGNPGPNFPLGGNTTYGYDYAKLTDNFLQVVPADKLTVIQGLYGYDWQVDEKNISQKEAKPRSLLEIQRSIIANCTSLQCEVRRDAVSAETTITYVDIDGKKHIVWFEDMESVKKKQEYLKSRGITSYSLWANSYF